MTHVISATFTRFDRMPPTAAVLAVLLHVVAALALWWSASLNGPDPDENAIDVTIEQPKPQPRPTPPPADAKPVPTPTPPAPPMPAPIPAARPASPAPALATHVPFGLTSPSPTTAEKTEQMAPKGDPVQTPPTEPPKPDTQVEEKPPTPAQQQPPPPPPPQQQQQQALAPPQSEPTPPLLERAMPPVDTPQAPLTSKDFPHYATPPPAEPRTRPSPQPGPQPQLRPSPLSQFQQKNAPAGDTRNNSASATFVNPAAEAAKTRLIEQYTFQLIQRIAQYRPYLKEQHVQGTVIVRLVLSTDGRLVDASISRSSGLPDLDRALMESVRAASPYPPIPAGLANGQGTFLLPLGFRPD